MTPIVTINNVSKSFVKSAPPALKNMSASFEAGRIIGMAGPDGAGKTTLIRMIAGLLKPTSGTLSILGYDTIKDAEQIHQFIGYMPQKFGLYEDLTVIQNLNLFADLKNCVGRERTEAFEKLLSFTSLKPFQHRLAGALSGGMKQKLGLACALLGKPKLLLLDEPSVGVDPISRRELWKMVAALLQEGITVVWSTAYLDEAERCNTVLLLNEGKLLYNGPPEELTAGVEGRAFLISNALSRRETLHKVLLDTNVIDGVIQGSEVRIVTKQVSPAPIDIKTFGDPACVITPTKPRFEDAFIDILGGGPGGLSELAEKTPEIYHPLVEEVIKADLLTKKYGSFAAASDITFSVRSGEIFGLLGPNGAGKSTIFKMLCGLLKPSSGKAFVNGLDLQVASGKARSHIGYMAQKFSLYGNLSVAQNLDFFSGIYGLQGKVKRDIIHEMIDIFSLKPYLNVNADTLPLGFKQRLGLSSAVMHRPQILFLDEPTSGVDPITRREFWNHINGLVEKGITVMVTTHFMDEAEYCDRIALVYRSKIINIGTPDALKKKAASKENPQPTLEDAFIELIHAYDEENDGAK